MSHVSGFDRDEAIRAAAEHLAINEATRCINAITPLVAEAVGNRTRTLREQHMRVLSRLARSEADVARLAHIDSLTHRLRLERARIMRDIETLDEVVVAMEHVAEGEQRFAEEPS